ncbi:MAG: hypothetical protein QOH79_3660 [Acidimicrobiaceae bacterium]
MAVRHGGPPPGAPPGGPAYAAPAAAAARGGPGKIIAIVVVLALLAGGGAYLLTKGDGSSGSLKDFCAKANALHNSIDFDVALSDPARVDGVINALDQVTKAAPNEIKNDMNTLNDGLKRARSNVKAGKAPDNGFSDADRSKLDTASSNVERFGKANCGPDFQVSSSSVDTSFSFDSSSFTDSLSSQFSGFDTDSLSSLCEGFRSQFGSDFVCDNS